MLQEKILESNVGQIAVIELAYGKVNAIDIEFCQRLITKLTEIRQSEIRAVVLSSQLKAFSAGIDLKRWLAESTDYVRPYMLQLEALFETIFCFPKPMISDINGHAIAGGFMMATACDYRIIRPDAKIGIHESRLGVPLPMLAIEIMRHVAVPSVFRKISTIGATYRGESALAAGLVDEIADDSRAAAIRAAEELARIPAVTFELTKRQRVEPVMRIVNENRNQLLEPYLKIWESPTIRNAIREYVDQRLK